MSAASIISVESVIKQFGPVRALGGVSFELFRGQVHGLVGENGAGKSTLMKILSGLEQPTSGQIRFDGRPIVLRHPFDAARRGIVMIHQELNLVEELSVADNIFLGRERTRFGLIERRKTDAQAAALLAEVGCAIDAGIAVKRLSIAGKQMVEITKALSIEARVLILDEPTAVLTRRETVVLFSLIERLKSRGVAIVYISHILSEVLAVCDQITVLRDGNVVNTIAKPRAKTITERELAGLMVGRAMGEHFPPRRAHGSEVALKVSNISVPGRVIDASFEVRAGEIMGFAGLIGAGRTELAEAIAGLRARSAGTIEMFGKTMRIRGPRDGVRAGIAYLPEDRKGTGLAIDLSVAANTTMVSLKRYARPLISRRAEEAATNHYINRLHIKASSPRVAVRTLSGGNQQKVALAKWLEISPRVLLIDEPTRGVDIGAKEQIYALIQSLTAQGMACILISSELNEVLGMSHRIAVMRAGRIVAVLDGRTATEHTVMQYAAGVERTSAA